VVKKVFKSSKEGIRSIVRKVFSSSKEGIPINSKEGIRSIVKRYLVVVVVKEIFRK
jgi:hypothetical protein